MLIVITKPSIMSLIYTLYFSFTFDVQSGVLINDR